MTLPQRELRLSPTLAANEAIRRRMNEGRPILHLAFGEAGLPIHPALQEALSGSGGTNSYAPVAGEPWLRESAAKYFERRGLITGPEQIVVGPGSKALLFALFTILPGDVVLPQPSWVSYAAQATIAGKRVFRVPIPSEAGGCPNPDGLRTYLRRIRMQGADPRILVLTQPDNPTGTVIGREILDAITEVARHEGLVVIADEIYRDLTFDVDSFVSAADVYPEGTIITTGLSKSLALGGWRIGVMRVPANSLGRNVVSQVCAIGSEVWSCIPGPIASVAQVGFDERPEISAHIAVSRQLHEVVVKMAFEAVTTIGLECRPPMGAFYLYPDLDVARPQLARRGIVTGSDLADVLLKRFDIAVLEGKAFGDEDALRVRISTSLLYGETDEERWRTLRLFGDLESDRNEECVRKVSYALDRLQDALIDLTKR